MVSTGRFYSHSAHKKLKNVKNKIFLYRLFCIDEYPTLWYDKSTKVMYGKGILMLCNNCGSFVEDGCYYCPRCGKPVNNETQWSAYEQNANQNQNYTSTNSYNSGAYNNTTYNSGYNNYNSYEADQIFKKLEDSKLLGILAIVLGLFVSSVIGIILAVVGKEKLNDINIDMYSPFYAKKEQARKLNNAGIIIPIVRFAVAILFFIIYFAFIATVFSTTY